MGVHKLTYENTLSLRSVTDFVVVLSDLRLYVFETQVKTGAQLAMDHHPVVSWIRWLGITPKRVVSVG